MGHSTQKALEFAKRCADHHKSWKILEILYLAITDELLVPFVRYCLNDNLSPSVVGYWKWAEDICDPNYMYMQQMALTFYMVLCCLELVVGMEILMPLYQEGTNYHCCSTQESILITSVSFYKSAD